MENYKDKKYNLKNDIIFKAFFARKGNEEFLKDFLESLLKLDIADIQIEDEVSLEKLRETEKGGRLDLQAILNNGTIVNIELQIRNEYNIEERTTYYSSKVISRETQRGTAYEDIKQVIMINILGYEMFEYDDYISRSAIVLENHREYEVLKGIKWYFIELPKFRKQHPNMDDKVNQWLAFIDDNDRGLVKMAEEKNKTIKKAREEMTYLTGDEEVQRLAWLREKWEMDRVSAIKHAEKQGEQLGKKDNQIEIAKKLLQRKMPIEDIQEITLLSKEEIEKLK